MIPEILIAPNLTNAEVRCKCGDCNFEAVHRDLLNAWTLLRSAVGAPITIISGNRCPEHNAKVGGAENSQHLFGRAIDISCEAEDLHADRWFHHFVEAGFKGIGRGNGILHLDVRSGPPSCWRYLQSGGYTPDGEALALLKRIRA